jgi:hypothetical protein
MNRTLGNGCTDDNFVVKHVFRLALVRACECQAIIRSPNHTTFCALARENASGKNKLIQYSPIPPMRFSYTWKKGAFKSSVQYPHMLDCTRLRIIQVDQCVRIHNIYHAIIWSLRLAYTGSRIPNHFTRVSGKATSILRLRSQ